MMTMMGSQMMGGGGRSSFQYLFVPPAQPQQGASLSSTTSPGASAQGTPVSNVQGSGAPAPQNKTGAIKTTYTNNGMNEDDKE